MHRGSELLTVKGCALTDFVGEFAQPVLRRGQAGFRIAVAVVGGPDESATVLRCGRRSRVFAGAPGIRV